MRFAIAAMVVLSSGGVLAGPASHASVATVSSAHGSPKSSRLTVGRERLVGADGSATTWSERFRDEELNADCSFSPASDGVVRCLPQQQSLFSTGGTGGNNYADASCRIPLVTVPTKLLGPSFAARWETINEPKPGWLTHVFSLGNEYPRPGTVYTMFSDHCNEAVRAPQTRYFLVGAEIPPARFVAVADRPASQPLGPVNGSRITTIFTRERPYYRDEKLGTDCRIAGSGDGVLRCVPVGGGAAGPIFADASCSVPLVVALADRNSASRNTSYAVHSTNQMDSITQTFVMREHVFRVGAEYFPTGPMFVGSPDDCREWRRAPETPPLRYFARGAEIAPDEFVAFRKETR